MQFILTFFVTYKYSSDLFAEDFTIFTSHEKCNELERSLPVALVETHIFNVPYVSMSCLPICHTCLCHVYNHVCQCPIYHVYVMFVNIPYIMSISCLCHVYKSYLSMSHTCLCHVYKSCLSMCHICLCHVYVFLSCVSMCHTRLCHVYVMSISHVCQCAIHVYVLSVMFVPYMITRRVSLQVLSV